LVVTSPLVVSLAIANGFWPVQLGNVFYYVRDTRNPATIEKYAHDTTVDRWDRLLFNHGLVGPAIGTAALCALIGLGWGLLAAGLHGVIYVFFLSSSINGLCHIRGYRTFDNHTIEEIGEGRQARLSARHT
jgi:fatty-acid desaturase